MGYKFELNWALKLKPEEGFPSELREGEIYKFYKKESRIYPLGCNLDLINSKWEVYAQVQIMEFTVNEKETKGEYKITKIYSELERKVLTKIAQENSESLEKKGYISKK